MERVGKEGPADSQDLDELLSTAQGLASAIGEDERAASIAAGLQQPVEDLDILIGEAAAGADRGRIFYSLKQNDLTLFVREDGMQAYVGEATGRLGAADLRRLLRANHLQNILRQDVDGAGEMLRRAPHTWVRVAQGVTVQAAAGELVYLHPESGDPVLSRALETASTRLRSLLEAVEIDAESLAGLHVAMAVPGDVIARPAPAGQVGRAGSDVFGREIPAPAAVTSQPPEAGLFVNLSAGGQYVAHRLGYVCLEEGRLSLLSPLWIDPQEIEAYLVWLGGSGRRLTSARLRQCLADRDIVNGIEEQVIGDLERSARQPGFASGVYLVARGTAPVVGTDGRVEMVVNTARRPGRERDDGSMDFRDVNFVPDASVGQVVARLVPCMPGTDGTSLNGSNLASDPGEEMQLEAGQNVVVETRDDGSQEYISTIEGMVKAGGDKIDVVEFLRVNGDISFNTGNIKFGGEVCVIGSVVQGFSVVAGAGITITGTVEAGCTVVTQGDLTVGRGIVGRKTKVVAGGTIRVQFVQEAAVVAGADLLVRSSTYHAHLRCGSTVTITGGGSERMGSIVGGETWALKGISAHVSGAQSGVTTRLVVGIDYEKADQLDRLAQDVDQAYDNIRRILTRFGLERIDILQITNMVKAATGPQRMVLRRAAQRLGEFAQAYQGLRARRDQLLGRSSADAEGAEISLSRTVFSGTEARVGDHTQKVVADLGPSRFRVINDRLVVQ